MRVLSGGHLAALASVVDKVTGDAITVDAVLPDQVSSFGSASAAPDGVGMTTAAQVHYLVPVVAHTPGRNGTFWVSTLWIQNPASTSQIVQLEYRPASGGVYTVKKTIGARQQVTFDDLVSDFSGAGNGTGALHVYAPVGVIVSSHTFTHNQDGEGTYGQFAQGLAEGDLIGVNQVGVLQKLSSSSEYRCNVGFTEFSGEDTQVAVTLFTRSFTSLVPIASKQYTVPAYKNLQINQIFSDMGVTGDHAGAVAWVTVTSGGKVYAYASNVDNLTGDAEFIAARLQ